MDSIELHLVEKTVKSDKPRLLSMYINALFGYLFVSVSAIAGHLMGLLNMSLSEVLSLGLAGTSTTVVIIFFVSTKKGQSARTVKTLFWFGLFLYTILFSCAIYFLRDMRFLGLIYALIAVTIELPFTTLAENISLSAVSLVSQTAISFVAIRAGQAGYFYNELFYILCFIPIFTMIAMIARQVNAQKKKIESGNRELTLTNEQLTSANSYLEREHEITSNEIILASQVQKSFFNEAPDNLAGWDVALYFRPLYGVSGDFYDFYVKDGDLKGISLFDVSGHGLSSALYTMLLKPTMFRLFGQMSRYSLGKVLSKLNRSIAAEFSELDNFITGIVLRFEDNRIEYVNAGHPELLLRRASTHTVKAIEPMGSDIKGEPIGLSQDFPYKSLRFTMKKGDILLLFTDCLIESGESMNTYGYKHLNKSLHEASDDASAQTVLNQIMSDFTAFAGKDLNDDLTVIVAIRK